ncbi:sigma-70 family RNA polymerase sigma factor [Cellulomonas sp. NPDC089187]|uniref:RNA polymerase sigma factor n=1 Tax=Cellulomonas sp. NPDC089187 TaxID=3154970 RepID=UPI003443B315
MSRSRTRIGRPVLSDGAAVAVPADGVEDGAVAVLDPAPGSEGLTAQQRAAIQDLALCVAVRRGDEDAFEQLYRRHVGWARQMAVRMIGPDDAEDIVSDTFVSLLGTLRRGGGPVGGVRGYLRAVMRRLSGHLRENREIPAESLSLLQDGADALAVDQQSTGSPEDTILDRDEEASAFRALDRLTGRERQLIELVDVQGASYREAADALGMTVGGVGRSLYLGRRSLFDAWVAEHVLPAREPQDHPTGLEIARHITGNHGVRGRRRVDAHVAACDECRRRVDLVDLERRTVPARRSAALSWFALLPLWWRRRHPAPVGWTHRAVMWAGIGLAEVVVVLVTMVAAPAQVSHEPPTTPTSQVSSTFGSAPTAAAGPIDLHASWRPGTTLSGAAQGDVVYLWFQIEATGHGTGPFTLTVRHGAGVEIADTYGFCTQSGTELVCPGLGPLSEGEPMRGRVGVRVTDVTAARLPTLTVTR